MNFNIETSQNALHRKNDTLEGSGDLGKGRRYQVLGTVGKGLSRPIDWCAYHQGDNGRGRHESQKREFSVFGEINILR